MKVICRFIENIKEIYHYRSMIATMVHRDLRGRYKKSVLGFLWSFLNPLLQMFVYSIVFSVIMRTGIDKYYIFLFAALVPWIFFGSSMSAGAVCITSSPDLIKKIYFPREVIPIACTTSAFVNMLLSFLMIFVILIFSGFGINPKALIFLPVIMLIEYVMVLGMTFLWSSVTVYFRDMEHILGIISLAWQFLTPVMYPQSMVTESLSRGYLTVWNLNPMTPVVNAYRDILYYKKAPEMDTLLSATILGIVVLALGYVVFEHLKRRFAEEM